MKSKLIVRLAIFVAILVSGMAYVVNLYSVKAPLRVFYPKDLNPKLVDSTLKGKKDYPLFDYTLVNQLGDSVSQNSYVGKIKVVDFFFTTCRSICPKMTVQLQRVQQAFPDNQDIQLISHTVTPDIDSVAVLKAYSEQYSSNDNQWHFLTGKQETIYNLARKRYFAVVDEPSAEGPDFIHTENIVLVDAQEQLRGFYDGTNPEEIDQLIEDLEWLLTENAPENEK